jgi:glutathione S-transferase
MLCSPGPRFDSAMIKLYDYELSGNCYKVRLLLHLLGQPFERIELDFYPGREHKSPWFLAINPLGQLPVLDDAGFILPDAQAILVHLASRYDPAGRWYPGDPDTQGQIAAWLRFAESLTGTVGAARLHDTIFYALDVAAARAAAHVLFRELDEHLWFAEQQGQPWLCSRSHPTIADIACFPYVMLSEEGGIARLPYPAIRRWTDRLKGIPRFTLMSGIFGAAPAQAPLIS